MRQDSYELIPPKNMPEATLEQQAQIKSLFEAGLLPELGFRLLGKFISEQERCKCLRDLLHMHFDTSKTGYVLMLCSETMEVLSSNIADLVTARTLINEVLDNAIDKENAEKILLN